MNENAKSKGRSAIYGMAGFYLLYTAYQIFQQEALSDDDPDAIESEAKED